MRTELDHDFDPELRRLLDAAVRSVDPPVSELILAGLAAGRRARRRRAALLSAGLTAAVVAVVATNAAGLFGGGGQTQSPRFGSTPEPMVTVDARSGVAVLASLLPDRGTTSAFGGGPAVEGFHGWPAFWGFLTYDDGDGPVQIFVQYDHGWLGQNGHPVAPTCADFPGLTCTLETLPDGSTLLTYDPDNCELPGTHELSVELFRPDGTRVGIRAINRFEDLDDGSWGPVTRANLPLDAAQLAAIVTNPVWQDTVPESFADAGNDLDPFELIVPATATPTPPVP